MRIIPVLLSLFCLLSECRAEEDPSQELTQRIEQINAQIEDQQRDLGEVESRIADLDKQLKTLKGEREALQREETALVKELQNISNERERSSAEERKLAADAKNLRSISLERMRVLYMHPREELLTSLLHRSSSESFTHFGYYLSVVRSYDQQLLERYQEVAAALHDKQAELVKLTEARERLVGDLKSKRAKVAASIAAQEPVIRDLKDQRSKRETVVTALRAQALRFETVLTGLTGGQIVARDTTEGREVSKPQTVSPAVLSFEGPGLDVQRKELVVPVEGKALSRAAKGLEFQTTPGSVVKAIARGRVIFLGRMPIYGMILILDHGERYYSLYGRISNPKVERSSEVERGAELAVTGEPDAQGRNFYFEVRKNGQPTDARKLFGKRL